MKPHAPAPARSGLMSGTQADDTVPQKPAPAQDAGLAKGTLVLTRRGECPAEEIKPGDQVISRDLGLVQVSAVEQRRVRTRAVSIAAGSLGDTRPDTDLILPAGQKILIRDWRAQALFRQDQALVTAAELVDNEFICDLGLQEMELTVLRFARAHVLYAGGLEVAGATLAEAALRPAA